MEHEKTFDGQIHASIAKRVGLILTQYEKRTGDLPANQRYEATLCLSLLHTLLTQCMELIDSDELSDLKTALDQPLTDKPSLFGLSSDCVQTNTIWSADKLTHRNVIKSLRNSMSHPNKQTYSAYPVTGFTQCLSDSEPLEDGLRQIEGFELIHSPWVRASGRHLNAAWKASTTAPDKKQKLENDVQKFATTHGFENLTVSNIDGMYKVYQGADLFVPTLILRLTTAQLQILTRELGRHLSKPLTPEGLEPAPVTV